MAAISVKRFFQWIIRGDIKLLLIMWAELLCPDEFYRLFLHTLNAHLIWQFQSRTYSSFWLHGHNHFCHGLIYHSMNESITSNRSISQTVSQSVSYCELINSLRKGTKVRCL